MGFLVARSALACFCSVERIDPQRYHTIGEPDDGTSESIRLEDTQTGDQNLIKPSPGEAAVINSPECQRMRADLDTFDYLINNLDRNRGGAVQRPWAFLRAQRDRHDVPTSRRDSAGYSAEAGNARAGRHVRLRSTSVDQMVSTVELRVKSPSSTEERYARFVLRPDGAIVVVGWSPGGKYLATELIRQGVPAPIDGMVTTADGMAFLNALRGAFRGSRLWATPVIEMPQIVAIQSID